MDQHADDDLAKHREARRSRIWSRDERELNTFMVFSLLWARENPPRGGFARVTDMAKLLVSSVYILAHRRVTFEETQE